ncbi:hypothetical protein FCM35_KLT10132 [Carex littledalei]|uniref:Uncharacterized protein n=1 Tax=Carex littledalei TaxID=544730 RepID=A0A833RV80_9POAL|nr:hypothetical protein FCM35_KLT10132 [Carex littledalei]
MAPVSVSKPRAKRAKTSLSVVNDANANNPASVSAAGSLFPAVQTPPPPYPRRSLRFSTPSTSPSNNPNPNHSAISGPGSTSATDGALGRGRPSVQKERTGTGTGSKMGAGEGRRMTLRSGSQIRVTPEGTTSNAEIANYNRNSTVAAATAIAPGRPGRPKRHNPADQDLHQQQQEGKEMGGGGDNDKEEEMTLEEKHLSFRLRSRTGGDKDKGKGKLIIDEESGGKTSRVGISRFMDKGKARMVVDKDSESDSDYDFITVEEHDGQFTLGEEVGPVLQGTPPAAPAPGPMPLPRREAQRRMAIDLAPKYAYFRNDDEAADSDGDTDDESVPDAGAHDWPGPFSTAMKIIEEREAILRARQEAHSSKGPQSAVVPISWMPSRDKSTFARKPPSLQSLCIKVLADNAHEIESLEALPDMVKSMFVPLLCHSRKMTAHHLSELVRGSPVELQFSDCSWASDKEFEDIFTRCDASQLKASFSSGLGILCLEMQCITSIL